MRQYPSDSPEALTRIVALALMADGIIDPSELRLLKDQEILSRLGLDPDSFDRVFYEFCTDMLTRRSAPRLANCNWTARASNACWMR